MNRFAVHAALLLGFLWPSEPVSNGALDFFAGDALVGKQIVRAQNIQFAGDSRKWGNNPDDFDLGQWLRDGHVVVVSFFQNTCVNCRFEMPWLDALALKYREKKLTVLYIDVSESHERRDAESRRYLEELRVIHGHAYYDFLGTIAKSYFVRHEGQMRVPVLFVIGKDYRFKFAKQGWAKPEAVEAFKTAFEKNLSKWLDGKE